MTRNILQIRQGMCLEIAEQLEAEFRLGTRAHSWDRDEAARLIDSRIPDTYDEAEARDKAIDAEIAKVLPEPTVPSLGQRLRESMGFHAGASLRDVLEEAIRRGKAFLPLAAACRMVLDDPGLTASANDVIRDALSLTEERKTT